MGRDVEGCVSVAMISSIMVTRGRPQRALRSVDMFLKQILPEESELLVIADIRSDGWKEVEQKVSGVSKIRFFAPPPVETYVELRNFGMDEARGEVLCMWDDDDFYHPKRLSVQFSKMVSSGSKACFFGDYIHYNEQTKKLRWVRYPWGGLPGTLMCLKSAKPRYPTHIGLESGRDSSMQVDLMSRIPCIAIPDGYLYVYVYHGGNVWDSLHHQQLAARLVSPDYVKENFVVAQKHLDDMGFKVDQYRDLLW